MPTEPTATAAAEWPGQPGKNVSDEDGLTGPCVPASLASPLITAEPFAYYIDGEGDMWIGNKDGTVSLMDKVPDDDRYAHRDLAEMERMTTSMTKIGSADVG